MQHSEPGDLWQLTAPLATVWRSDRTLQLGLEPPGGLLVPSAPTGLVAVIDALAKPSRRAELEAAGGPSSGSWLEQVLRLLVAAGLARAVRPGLAGVTVIGRGRLVLRLAQLLLAGMSGPVRLIWPGSPVPPRPVMELRGRHPERLSYAGHWGGENTAPDGLTVLAAQAPEPDRSLVRELAAGGRAHLVVRASDLGCIVGPLVVPGRTACLRCEDLHRCGTDPQWPRLLAQLCRRRPAAGALELQWAVSTAVVQVRAWRNGTLPDALGAGLELGADGTLRTRRLRAHPGCGCLAAG